MRYRLLSQKNLWHRPKTEKSLQLGTVLPSRGAACCTPTSGLRRIRYEIVLEKAGSALWRCAACLKECWHLGLSVCYCRGCPLGEIEGSNGPPRKAGPTEKPHRNIAGEARNKRNPRPKGLSYWTKWLRNQGVRVRSSGGAGFAMCNICKPPCVLVYGNAETRPDERAGNNATDGGDSPCQGG